MEKGGHSIGGYSKKIIKLKPDFKILETCEDLDNAMIELVRINGYIRIDQITERFNIGGHMATAHLNKLIKLNQLVRKKVYVKLDSGYTKNVWLYSIPSKKLK